MFKKNWLAAAAGVQSVFLALTKPDKKSTIYLTVFEVEGGSLEKKVIGFRYKGFSLTAVVGGKRTEEAVREYVKALVDRHAGHLLNHDPAGALRVKWREFLNADIQESRQLYREYTILLLVVGVLTKVPEGGWVVILPDLFGHGNILRKREILFFSSSRHAASYADLFHRHGRWFLQELGRNIPQAQALELVSD